METKLPATYTGVSLWELSLAGYLPSNTTFAKAAGDTITKIWTKPLISGSLNSSASAGLGTEPTGLVFRAA